MTSLNAFPSSTVYPTKDEDGNPLETEYGLSVYKDHQTFTIQVIERLILDLKKFRKWAVFHVVSGISVLFIDRRETPFEYFHL